jgi:hypothetical protein
MSSRDEAVDDFMTSTHDDDPGRQVYASVTDADLKQIRQIMRLTEAPIAEAEVMMLFDECGKDLGKLKNRLLDLQ